MSKLQDLQKQIQDLSTIGRVVEAYENISSLQIRQIRDRVLQAREFFHELWSMYDQLTIDVPIKQTKAKNKSGSAAVLISSDLSFASGLDEQIIQTMLESIKSRSTEIVAVGIRGAQLLASRNVDVSKTFHLPGLESKINIVPVMSYLEQFESVTLYFARFDSITEQTVVAFELHDSVARLQRNQTGAANTELMFASDYLFEPSLDEVVSYLEKTMSSIALTQIMLETTLSQLAYRYNNLSRASESAKAQLQTTTQNLNSFRRRKRDIEALAYIGATS